MCIILLSSHNVTVTRWCRHGQSDRCFSHQSGTDGVLLVGGRGWSGLVSVVPSWTLGKYTAERHVRGNREMLHKHPDYHKTVSEPLACRRLCLKWPIL